MNRTEAHKVAVDMFQKEHVRWVQNALVLFVAYASLFLVRQEVGHSIPLWLFWATGTLISSAIPFVVTSIRGSTDAWAEAIQYIEEIEGESNDVKPFKLYRDFRGAWSPWRDLGETLCVLRTKTLFSVTRLYALLGVGLTLVSVALCLGALP